MNHNARHLPFPTLLVLGFSLLLGGCGAHRLSQAQDAFSKGAELENLLTLRAESGAISYLSADDHYLIAHNILRTDLKDRKDELVKDGLLGHALALHAMTLWRMADLATLKPAGTPGKGDPGDAYYADADKTRKAALALGDQLGPRDKFMMTILPDLRDHEIGLRHSANSKLRLRDGYATVDSVAAANDAVRFFGSSHSRIKRALSESDLPENHVVRVYALQAQLQTLVAWNAVLEAAVVTPPAAHDPGKYRSCFDKLIRGRLEDGLNALGRYDDLLQRLNSGAVPVRSGRMVTSRLAIMAAKDPPAPMALAGDPACPLDDPASQP